MKKSNKWHSSSTYPTTSISMKTTVTLDTNQYELIVNLLSDHYSLISNEWRSNESIQNAYKAIIAMRIPLAEKAWKEYCKSYPDPEWRAYPTKEDFFRDQFTIYPEDLK